MLFSLVESLEIRRLLAGNVTVAASENFTLSITGDKKNNALEVRLEGLEGTDGYRISGVKRTRINGRTELVLHSRTAAFMNLSMGKGDDVINLVGAFNTQGVTLLTGDGKDRVNITSVSHFGDLLISTGKGKDDLSMSEVRVTQNLSIDLGHDDDHGDHDH